MNKTFDNDLVSVIIPTFNVADYIGETIQSVLDQTYKNFEIIIIDDCSTDNTCDIVNTYAEKDSRVKCIRQNENMGAAVARNRGIEEANGRFIAFLDSDDLWDKEKLNIQINDMLTNNIAFSFSSYDFIDEDNNVIKGAIKIKRKFTYKDLLTKTMISTPTVVIDRNTTKNKLMPLRRTGQDYAYWMLLLRETDAYGIVKPLVHVRKRPNSLSKNKIQNIKDVWEVQTVNEKISKVLATSHIVGYLFYVLKKRYIDM